MTSYLTFQEIATNKKTKTFHVISKTDGSKLGEIKWHTGYRKYALFVESYLYFIFGENTYTTSVQIFDTVCLKEITSFIEKLMEERKADDNQNRN